LNLTFSRPQTLKFTSNSDSETVKLTPSKPQPHYSDYTLLSM
jgi:hypothetical protein